MVKRRVLAGSIVALLVCISALAAGCDLSCAFASINSDCHSSMSQTLDSESGAMKMDGMPMAGMTMPEMAGESTQQAVSASERARTKHPSIGDMGPCEKQSCDSETSFPAKTSHSVLSSFGYTAAAAIPHSVDPVPPDLHEAREYLPHDFSRSASAFPLSLRI